MHGEMLNLDRSLPSSEESERMILGSVLLDNDHMNHAAEMLRTEDFYSPRHRQVFGAMLKLHQRQAVIGPVQISEELKKDGSIESIGGISTITNLTYGLPHFTAIQDFTKIIREKSELRQLIRTCTAIASTALSGETEAAEIFAEAQTKINDLCLSVESGSTAQHFIPLRQVIESEVLPALHNLRHGISRKIKTGFPMIDQAIGGGIAPSDVLLVAADTGRGKSALALQLAYQISTGGSPVAFLAGEMSNSENVMRLLSQLSGITNLNWLSHITEVEYQNLVAWADAIKDENMLFDCRISDLQTLGTYMRSIVRRSNIQVLVIDYIQLFKMEKLDKRKRNERIAEASQEVKRLANELNIAIIEVAQFNREGAKADRPSIHDLEGSGQLEKDASLIFLLDLSEGEFQDSDGRKYTDATIYIDKGRNVGRGEVRGRFYGRSVQFSFD